jgi:hypothetical protein
MVASCSEKNLSTANQSPATKAALSAYLSIASPMAERGDDVTFDVHLTGGSSTPLIGSYLMDIIVDTTSVRLIGVTSPDGLSAANTVRGGIRVAGAAADGFRADRLASVSVKVLNPAALRSTRLVIGELNSLGFRDVRALTQVTPTVFGQAGTGARK